MTYNANGQPMLTAVAGTSYTGLYASDSSYNVVLTTENTTIKGLYHPCGAYWGTVATSGGYYAIDGSINIIQNVDGTYSPLYPIGSSAGTSLPPWVPNPTNLPDIAINWTTNQAWEKGVGLTTPTALGVTTSRASVKQVVDSNGNWSQVAANITAVSNLGRSTEEARTNSIRNNSMVGAVAGSPGTLPTNWSMTNITGLTFSLGTPIVLQGVNVLPITISGTAGATGGISLIMENLATASNGQAWTGSIFTQLVSGTWPRTFSIEIDELNSGAFLNGASVVASQVFPSLLTRYSGTYTNVSASTNQERIQFRFNITSGDVVSGATFYIGWPQLELGASVTSPIVTSGSAATRAADVTSMPVTVGSAYTLFEQATPQAPVGYGTTQGMLVLDDGTGVNRSGIRRAAATADPTLSLVGGTGLALGASGAPVWAQNVSGTLAASAAAGAQAISFNNGAIASGSVATLPNGLSGLYFGVIASSPNGLFNGLATKDAIWLTQAIPNSQLQALQ